MLLQVTAEYLGDSRGYFEAQEGVEAGKRVEKLIRVGYHLLPSQQIRCDRLDVDLTSNGGGARLV